jgi:hypothetical protein
MFAKSAADHAEGGSGPVFAHRYALTPYVRNAEAFKRTNDAAVESSIAAHTGHKNKSRTFIQTNFPGRLTGVIGDPGANQ